LTLSFTVLGPPRTKKTSSRIVHIGKFTKILPSEAHELWFKVAMQQSLVIRRTLCDAGAHLPLPGPVEISAVFYRQQASGDLLGYAQALADWMQEPRMSRNPGRPPRMTRNGAGIIRDDVQIVSWDGSRLRKDAANPRIEVTIRVLGPGQPDLFEEEPCPE
jgi:hypothetical protein